MWHDHSQSEMVMVVRAGLQEIWRALTTLRWRQIASAVRINWRRAVEVQRSLYGKGSR